MKDPERENDKNTIITAISFLVIGLLTILWFIIFKPFNDWSFNTDSTLFGQFGDFIGGFVGTIFSLVAIIFLYKTLIAQQRSIKKQDEAIDLQKSAYEIELFETTFFNLLKTQQELTNAIKAYFHRLNENFSTVQYTVLGREFFAYSNVEIKKIWLSIENESYVGMFDDSEDYITYLKEEIGEFYNPESPSFCHPDEAKFEESKIRNEEKLRHTNKHYKITKDIWENTRNLDTIKKIEKIYGLYFQRYHYAIGHYFRHLYHIIKYVCDFKPSSEQHYDINMKYINFIQAQMSSFELMLLFYNACAFPKLLKYLRDYNFLENLAEEDLIDKTHNCIEGITLKNRIDLLDI